MLPSTESKRIEKPSATVSDAARLQLLFAAAVELSPEERDAMLRRECAGDAALLAELLELVHMDDELRETTVQPIARGLVSLIAAAAPMASLSGMRVGQYQLREELGRGGMGQVYRAERVDGAVDHQVAIKLVRRELLDAATLKRFMTERQTLASLDHPNIARLFDAAELDDGTPYFVMEYVAGKPIGEYCAQTRLTTRDRVRLVSRLCAAVTRAHRSLIVHRDIKPSNILVTADGIPKLLDFGIAKALGTPDTEISEHTGTAQRYFSPLYAAPEQVLGAPIGVACDVYALGLLLYELLTGARPFEFSGLTAGQIERLITTVPPTAPSAVGARALIPARELRQLHGDLDHIVLRCLRKAPAERYASVEQLEADLENYLWGRPIQSRGGHTWYRVRKFVGRHRLAVTMISLVAVALGAAAIALLVQNTALMHERDRARHALQFLKSAFLAADPAHVAGADVSARQILDATRPKLDLLFDTEPALFASLAATVGEVQLAVGLAPQAADLAGRAVTAAQRAGLDESATRDLLVLHGSALSIAGQLDNAAEQLTAAARLGAADTTEWKLAQGRLLCVQGHPAQAVPMLQQARDEVSARLPTDELATSVRLQLAEAFRADRQYAASLAVLDATLVWQRAGLPENHPMIVRSRLRRIELLRQHGRVEEALAEAFLVTGEVERLYGAETSYAAVANTSLGMVLDDKARYDESIKAYRQALVAWQRVVGDRHINTIRATSNLADALAHDRKNDAEVAVLYSTLLAKTTDQLGASSEMAVFVRLNLADFLIVRGRFREALTLLTADAGVAGLRVTKVNRSTYLEQLRDAYAGAGCANAGSKQVASVSETVSACLTANRISSDSPIESTRE